VNLLKIIAPPTIYIEIGQSSMKVVDGEDGLELSLERLENGRLTPLCAERLTSTLRVFLKKHLWRTGLRAICAIGARGVSLRRLTLPGNPSDDELERLLPLQIEREFPLPPEELAWGYARSGKQSSDVLIAAVKRDVIEQYDEILRGSGLTATFTLAAAARGSLCSPSSEIYSILDIGRGHSELISFRNGLPEAVRVFAWGGENVTRAIARRFGTSHAEAEKSKIGGAPPAASNGEPQPCLQTVIDEEIDQLAKSLPANAVGHKLYLTGGGARLAQVAPRITTAIGNGATCERIDPLHAEGGSAAILALSRFGDKSAASSQLVLRPGLAREQKKAAPPSTLKWAAAAVLLLFACVALRYTPAWVNKPRLVRQLAQVKAYRESLPRIERELSFFEFLRTNQPAYLEPLFALANSAPSGTRIESITMSKRGDLSLRASMKDPQQVVQLRSKLIESGLFSSVVVEEQTPSSDRQKLSVRMSGQWKVTGKAPEPPASAATNRARSTPAGTNAPVPARREAVPTPSPS
jgi:Tfp pilus assembly PilM family ATPase